MPDELTVANDLFVALHFFDIPAMDYGKIIKMNLIFVIYFS